MLTAAKRLRAFFLHDRRRLGRVSRGAYRTRRESVLAALGEPEAVPGAIRCVPTFGSLADRHPHLHGRLIDGDLRRDRCFVALPPCGGIDGHRFEGP